MIRHLYILIVAILLSLIATTASADFIDFSSQEFQPADNQASYNDGDRGMTITAAPAYAGATIVWNSQYGLGVDTLDWDYGDNQIEGCETLSIDFDDSVYLASISLTNLYNEGFMFPDLEAGYYQLNDGSTKKFYADWSEGWGSDGEKTVAIEAENVGSITFLSSWWSSDDYSVKGIDITASGNGSNTSVPELDAESSVSALALLFGCVLVWNGRRRLTL